MDTEPHKCRFTVQIDAAVDDHTFVAPSFRFRFLDGSKKQTPVVGASGWTPLAPRESVSSSSDAQGRARSLSSPSLVPSHTLRYEHVVTDVSVTEAFATALDDDPIVSFFFADHAGLVSSAAGATGAITQPPAAQAKDAKSSSAATGGKATSSATPREGSSGVADYTPRAYAGLYELDVSSLLAGHLECEQYWADSTTHGATDSSNTDALQSVFSSKTKRSTARSPSQSLFAMLPPDAAAGLQYLAIRVCVDQPLLTPVLAKKLNPLTITVDSIRRLPGISSLSGGSGSGASSSPHAALRQSCRPVYASFQLFPDRLCAPLASSSSTVGRGGAAVGLQLPRRLVTTSGKPQAERTDWHDRATFLAGRFDRAELLDALQFGVLAVEVHDRDLAHTDRLQRLVAKWETLLATGVDITATRSSGSPSATTAAIAEPAVVVATVASTSRTTTPRVAAGHPQQQPPSKPLELFAVDDVARRDCRALLQRASELFPHGRATFRLDELLNTAKQLVGVNATRASTLATTQTPPQRLDPCRPLMSFEYTADVVSAKRRATPLSAGGLNNDDDENDSLAVVDLSPTARRVREPGAYLVSGTVLSICVTLQHAVVDAVTSSSRQQPQRLGAALASAAIGPATDDTAASRSLLAPSLTFSRIVLVIPYADTRTLQQVARVLTRVNLAALPGVSLQSYELADHEYRACASGQLDVVTGAQVIDSAIRTIVLEGLADGAMRHVHETLGRLAMSPSLNDIPRSSSVRVFANPLLRFPERLYTDFAVDLKRIKLRCALTELLATPDLYVRATVSPLCYSALTRLADMRRAQRLEDLARLDLFPTAAMLVEVERKYGESLTLDDIHGSGYRQQYGDMSSSNTVSDGRHGHDGLDPLDVNKAPETLGTVDNRFRGDGDSSNNNLIINSGGPATSTETSSKRHATSLKAPTDSTNDAFEQLRKSRKDRDFVAERRKELELARADYADKKKLADAQTQQSNAPVYMYSGQKLRTQDALQDAMREQLARDRRATFTYSREFQSLALSLVNDTALQQTEAHADRARWTTQRGFVYPPPRQPHEYNTHALAPSEARCKDLRAPFVDNANHPLPVSRGGATSDGSTARPAFSTLPSKDMVFGGTNADGTVDTAYFRSVHLCGDGLRREQDEARQRAVDDWTRRVVVDRKQLTFMAHGNTTGEPQCARPAQLDKVTDVLAGPVRSKPLRIVRNAALPSGKRVPLTVPPVSIHNQQPYVGTAAAQFATTLRVTDPTQFVVHRHSSDGSSDQTPQDFHFPSVTHVLTPPVKQHVTRPRAISAVAPTERTTLLWRNND